MSTAQQPQVRAQQASNQLLSHPFAQQAMSVANGQLKQLDRQLSQYPALNNFEAQTKIPKVYAILGFGGFAAFCIFFNVFGLAQLITYFVGFALPAYFSCRALDSPGRDDDTQWLTYWVIFGLINFIESAGLRIVLYYVPFYFLFKTIFLVWLMLPSTRGAEVMWRSFVQPMYRSYSGKIHGNTPTSGYATTTTSFNTASTEHIKSL